MFRFLKVVIASFAFVVPVFQSSAQQRTRQFSVDGLELDSDAFKDSLALPFWRALAAVPCAAPESNADFVSRAGLSASTQSLRKRLVDATGGPLPPAGSLLQRGIVFRTARYTIERVLVTSRIPDGVSFAYIVRQQAPARKSAAIVLVHGSGMQPLEAFGWNEGSYRAKERSNNAAFIASALEFAEAGYTVYVPWLADNAKANNWQDLQWATLERNGAALRPRVRGLGPLNFLVNEISAGVDYLSTLPDVDPTKLAIVGWGEGSQIAAMTAATDQRIAAVVRLSAPIDRKALRATVAGVLMDAHFTHVDCALGDQELAALIAPRPLLYAYSTKDESISRVARFISLPVALRIRDFYGRSGVANNYALQADTNWSPAASRRVRVWVDGALHFIPRAVPDRIAIRQPAAGLSAGAWIDSTQVQRHSYAASLGTCIAQSPRPDYDSVADFLRSVEPFRRQLANELGVPAVSFTPPVTVVRRIRIAQHPGYSLEFLQIRSGRTKMLISGLLAMPNMSAQQRMPAIVSADGDAGLATPFGLLGRERIPYLNAYADALASSGTIVFVPYYPFEFPEIAAAETAARTGGSQTSFTYTVPLLSASADFLLTMREVDSARVGIWGISFAGFAALYTAALDTRFSTLVYSNPVVTTDVLYTDPTTADLVAWYPEICHTVDAVQAYLIAPRRFVRENGLRDANGSERTPLESVVRIRAVYDSLGLQSLFTLVRHAGGHETRPTEVRKYLPK